MRYRRVLEEARGMVLIDKIEKEPRMNRNTEKCFSTKGDVNSSFLALVVLKSSS